MKTNNVNGHQHLGDKEITKFFDSLYSEGIPYSFPEMSGQFGDKSPLSIDSQLHLSECLECKKRLLDLYESVSLINKENRNKRLTRIISEKKIPLTLSAFSVAATILIFALIFTPDNQTLMNPIPSAPDISVNNPKTTDLVLSEKPMENNQPRIEDDFRPNQFYESLGEQFYRNPNFPTLSNLQEEYVGDSKIKIIIANSSGFMSLRIMDNRDVEIAKQEVGTDTVMFSAPSKPGKYYIVLESESEILVVKSFLVNYSTP